MAFKRAIWHSGLTYRQTCPCCNSVVEYTDYNLRYRLWFPDGFVYCPKCKRPLRHREQYALNPDGSPQFSAPASVQTPNGEGAFCTNCGRTYTPGVDHFCVNCVKKLD